jgi:hypothetical protein
MDDAPKIPEWIIILQELIKKSRKKELDRDVKSKTS